MVGETAVLDACVLVPPLLCDLLLRLAEPPALYVPVWSREILDEVGRNQPMATRMSPESIRTWRAAVETAFPSTGIEIIPIVLERCGNHPKDRHVLACAIQAEASSIVTFNLRDFRPEHLNPHKISAVHPSEFLKGLYQDSPQRIEAIMETMAKRRSVSRPDLLARLQTLVPRFVNHIL